MVVVERQEGNDERGPRDEYKYSNLEDGVTENHTRVGSLPVNGGGDSACTEETGRVVRRKARSLSLGRQMTGLNGGGCDSAHPQYGQRWREEHVTFDALDRIQTFRCS